MRDWEAAAKKAKSDAHNTAIIEACKEATESFAGEWVDKKFPSGRVLRVPADQKAFDAHKSACLAACRS